MGRRSGVPVNRNSHRLMDGAVSTDDLDIGVGIFGTDKESKLVARMAIYQYKDGIPTFRHVISFDLKTGKPLKRLSFVGGAPRSILESDMAMANWMRPLLFDPKITPGAYRWKLAPRAPLSELDPEEVREADANLQFTHPRWFFGQERTGESVSSMFQDYIQLDRPIGEIKFPEPQALVVRPGAKGCDRDVFVARQGVRTFCVQKYLAGLFSRKGGYRDLQDALLNALKTIDRLEQESSPILSASVARFEQSLKTGAVGHLKKHCPPEEMDRSVREIDSALALLRVYSLSERGAHGVVVPEGKQPPAGSAFISVVRPEFSIQCLDLEGIESHFPTNAKEVFGDKPSGD